MKASTLKILRQELEEYYDKDTKHYSKERTIKESTLMLKQLKQSKRRITDRADTLDELLTQLRELLAPYKTETEKENFRRF